MGMKPLILTTEKLKKNGDKMKRIIIFLALVIFIFAGVLCRSGDVRGEWISFEELPDIYLFHPSSMNFKFDKVFEGLSRDSKLLEYHYYNEKYFIELAKYARSAREELDEMNKLINSNIIAKPTEQKTINLNGRECYFIETIQGDVGKKAYKLLYSVNSESMYYIIIYLEDQKSGKEDEDIAVKILFSLKPKL